LASPAHLAATAWETQVTKPSEPTQATEAAPFFGIVIDAIGSAIEAVGQALVALGIMTMVLALL
jgi:hypothetical protein